MANINDYLQWRGDLTFEKSPLNEIDNMILSRFSYLPFRKIDIKEQETIESITEKFKDFKTEDYNIDGDKPLADNLLKSNRFKDIVVTDYRANTDIEAEKQFSAITLHLPNGELYISYCGTDNTIVGWKEDFNLSFMKNIPAQLDGAKYLKDIANKYDGKIHIGGHSKGGNIAVYAAVFADKNIQDRIIDVTNHDGPGFDKAIIETNEYARILEKIHTYIPQSSIIGRLLEHEEQYKIVMSVEKGIMQHDIYSWQVLGTKIIQMEEVSNGSEFINRTLRNWLQDTTPEQRKEVIDVIFNVIESTNATTLREMSAERFKSLGIILKSYKNIDEKDKKMINEVALSLGNAAKESLKQKFN